MESSLSGSSITSLERELTDAKEKLKKAEDAGDKDREIMYGNLVASIRNQISAFQKHALELPSIESLLGPDRSEPGVIRRMNIHFSSQVSLAIQQRNPQLAKDIYESTESLPSLNTANHYEIQGYQLDGPLFEGSTLIVCYRNSDNSKFVLKGLSISEAKRIASFLEKQPSNQYIIDFDFWQDVSKNKAFMLMPALPSTLEPIRFLVSDRTVIFWKHLESALTYIHNLGFAHCDVKPSNIGISYTSNFVLLDLGSITEFGKRPNTTLPYIPSDTKPEELRASAKLDWLMLSVTMAEKCCGKSGFDIGSRQTPPLDVVLDHLNRHLPQFVFSELRKKIALS